jgi:hypothetical protein
MKFKEEQEVKISNRFAALENLMMMMMIWTSVGLGKYQNIKVSATENLR